MFKGGGYSGTHPDTSNWNLGTVIAAILIVGSISFGSHRRRIRQARGANRIPPDFFREALDSRDRRIAAISHCGIPFYGPFLPWVILWKSKDNEFRMRHARAALRFQLDFLAVYVLMVFLVIAFDSPMFYLLVLLVFGLLVEFMNVFRALRGNLPIRIL